MKSSLDTFLHVHVLALESKDFLLPEKCFVIRSSDFTQWIWLIGFGTRLM